MAPVRGAVAPSIGSYILKTQGLSLESFTPKGGPDETPAQAIPFLLSMACDSPTADHQPCSDPSPYHAPSIRCLLSEGGRDGRLVGSWTRDEWWYVFYQDGRLVSTTSEIDSWIASEEILWLLWSA